jgi:hypothetical protein
MNRFCGRRINNWLSIAALTVAFTLAPGLLYAAAQSETSMVVRVEPEAFFQADSATAWTTAAGLETHPINLTVSIRLNHGTTGTLSISTSEDSGSTTAPLEVETAAGVQQITVSPILVGTFSQSGTYPQTVVIQRPSPAGTDSQPGTLVLRLSSSDGVALWSQAISLPADVHPAK